MDLQDLVAVTVSSVQERFQKVKRKPSPLEVIVCCMEQIDRFLHLEGPEKVALLVLTVEACKNECEPTQLPHLEYLLDNQLVPDIAKVVTKATIGKYDINTYRKSKTCSLFCWRK